jgi:Tol biopolymer transport system component
MNDLLVDLRALKRTMESGTTIISPPVSYRKPRRKTILLAASAVTALLCIGAVVFLLLPSYPSVELNPGMTMRVLPIPLTSIGYPGLSADGNWIAFPAADEKGNWDIYLMNAAAGEPRRITFDSSSSVSVMTAQISPDGSLIAYSPFSVQRKDVSIHLVSALGGRSRIIAENAFIPVWQPDGRRVFYMRGLFSPRPSSSGKLEIWSVKPDGSDERLEVIDTISVLGRTSLSISPNGKNIIWIRSFSEGQYQELVITDLKNKEERQLTFDKKNIDEVYWAPNDQIIFSSNKSGSTNLWMVPAAGGQEIQITKGAGPDVGMKVSADGKRLLYYQNQFTGNIWIGSLENGSAHQLTFDETIKQLPMLSPDGKSIAFLMSSFDPLNPHSDLYVCDNDGLNRRILSTNQDVVFRPYWSQDSRSIAYPVRQSDINADSVGGSKTYVVDVAKSLRPKFIANGRPLGWVSSTILQVVTSPGTPRAKGMLTSIEMGRQGLSSQDSALLKPIWGHRLVGQDWGLLIGKDDLTDGVIAKIMSFQREGARVSTSLDFKHAILCEKPGELWRISLAEGERKRVPFVFPGLSTDFSVSPDGKQLVYVQQRQQGRLVMIENPFK